MNRRTFITIAAMLCVLLLIALLFKMPLATVSTDKSATLYINATRQNSTTVHTTIGNTRIAASSPLHTAQSKRVFLWPFQSVHISPSPNVLTVADILKLTKVQLRDYVIGDTTFSHNNTWLVVNVGSPQPDGGAYTVILNWQPYKGQWKVVGLYDGSNGSDFQNIVPTDVARNIGL